MNRISGYASNFSATNGESLSFFVSTERPTFDARVRRIYSVDDRPGGPGARVDEIDSDVAGSHPGQLQTSTVGAYATANLAGQFDPDSEPVFSIAFLPKILPHDEDQWITRFDTTANGFLGLRLRGDVLELVQDDHVVAAPHSIAVGGWHRSILTVGSAGATLAVTSSDSSAAVTVTTPVITNILESHVFSGLLTLGGTVGPSGSRGSFNGKIAEVRFGCGTLTADERADILDGRAAESVLGSRLVSGWHFGRDTSSTTTLSNIVAGSPAC